MSEQLTMTKPKVVTHAWVTFYEVAGERAAVVAAQLR